MPPTKTVEDVEGVNGTKFKSIMLVSIYRYAKTGMSEAAIHEELKVSGKTWRAWKKKFPSINQAIKMAQNETKDSGNWQKYIYDRLRPDLQALWDRIHAWDEEPNGVAKIEALLADHGKSVRQQLYLHALIQTNFSPSRAMRKVCIDKDTLEHWVNNDPAFAELIEQIQWHKDNFFEESFIRLVANGSEAATLHAAKSRLRDRGYGIRNEVDVRHSGSIDHNMVDLSDLELTQDVKMAILEAVRRREEKIAAERTKPLLPPETRFLEDLSNEIAEPVEMAT